MPLGAEHRAGTLEILGIEVGKGGEVTILQRADESGRHVPPGILDQRNEIVAGRPRHRVLKVDQAAGGEPLPSVEAHQVVDVEIAQHQRLRHRAGLGESLPPARPVGGSPVGVNAEADRGQIPVDEMIGLRHQQIVGIGRQAGRDGRRGGKAVERDQRVDGELVERRLVLAAGEQLREGVVAQILHQKQPGGPLLRLDARRAEAE